MTRLTRRAEIDAQLAPWLFSRAQLLKLCLRFTRGHLSDAEDLLSDAFLRAMEAQTRGLDVTSPFGFSATVMANVARDRLRAAGKRRGSWAAYDDEVTLRSSNSRATPTSGSRELQRVAARACGPHGPAGRVGGRRRSPSFCAPRRSQSGLACTSRASSDRRRHHVKCVRQ